VDRKPERAVQAKIRGIKKEYAPGGLKGRSRQKLGIFKTKKNKTKKHDC